MIMLAGIVVNNAIVLVDYINTLRRRGLPRDEAIVTRGHGPAAPDPDDHGDHRAGPDCRWPWASGDGAEIRTPMAIAVISGLISSTALTLVVIPSIYALADDAEAAAAAAADRRKPPAQAAVRRAGRSADPTVTP